MKGDLEIIVEKIIFEEKYIRFLFRKNLIVKFYYKKYCLAGGSI